MDTTPIRNLGHLRGIKGLSQKELAYKCGIIRTTLSKIESGRLRPSLEEVRRIAEALGTSEAEVIQAVKQMDSTLWVPKSDRAPFSQTAICEERVREPDHESTDAEPRDADTAFSDQAAEQPGGA